MKKVLFFVCFFSAAFLPGAQQPRFETLGPNPTSIRWNQLKTPAGRIIYPAGLDSMARRVAGLMNYQQLHAADITGREKTKKVPVLLQNLSIFPEGFSTPAPWRNEYFVMPPQNLFTGPTPWLDYLAVHEYRHAQQFDRANRGFTWLFKIPMGQTGWLLNSLVNQPLWFREGDAVVAESAFTKAGRGRFPRFHMETRALLLSGRRYSYEKAAYSASFKDFIPNPYRTGYYMTMKARQDFNDTIWQKVLHDTYNKELVYAFTRSLKKNTGLRTPQLYERTMQELDSLWKAESGSEISADSNNIRITKSNTFTNYRFSHYLPDGSILSLKDGFNQIRTFTTISENGKEKYLFPYGVYSDDHVMFAAEGTIITWAEAAFDERWSNKTYSVIKMHDLASGRTKKITRKTRYFAPAPSADGSRIAAIEVNLKNESSLVVLNKEGTVLRKISFPANLFVAQPRFTEDGKHVLTLAVSKSGNSLIEIDVEEGNWKELIGPTTTPIARPYARGDYIYFSAGYTGIDNIYALERTTSKLYQITSVRFGAYEPMVSADNQKLLYSSYTADGYRLQEVMLDKTKWKPVDALSNRIDMQPYSRTLKEADLTDSLFSTPYKQSRYHAFTSGLFNVHSLFPYVGLDQFGLQLSSQNLMNTLNGVVTPFYNTLEKTFGAKVDVAYAALYPIVHLQAGYQTRSAGNLVAANDAVVYKQDWNEKYVAAGFVLPLQLTQGVYSSRLMAGGYFKHYRTDFLDSLDPTHKYRNFNFNSVQAVFSFSRLLPKARQHINPRWGQTLRIDVQQALNKEPGYSSAIGQLFFPGFSRNHSFYATIGWKEEAVKNTYRFGDDFVRQRGYKPAPFDQQYLIQTNYALPLWYPDLSLGGLAFLQRLRSNIFYDYDRMQRWRRSATSHTIGLELALDLRLLRLFGMTMEVRYNKVLKRGMGNVIPFQFVVSRFELQN